MKIKKVEIQAFRAYDKAENSTFDFGISGDKYADFVSLYAPNGFGKTSFYDAVEYSYTNNIDRLLKNKNKDVAKSEKNINKSEKQYILRNRLSDANLESYVKLTTTSNVFNKKIPAPRKNAADYKFDENETERGYFREVILSQDWISSFLREDKPDERFTKFIDFFGDKDLDNYRKSLDELITKNEKLLKSLQNDLKGILPKLKYDSDIEILSKINEKINLLNELGNHFRIVDTYTSGKDILELSNTISERKNDLNHNISRLREVFTELELLISGNERIVSFRVFRDYIKEQTNLTERLSSLAIIRTKFINLKQKKDQIESIQNKNKELDSEKNQKDGIVKIFPDYTKIIIQIQQKEKEISDLKIAKESSSKEISETESTLNENTAKTDNFQNLLNEVEKKIEQLPEIVKIIESSQNNITKVNDDIEQNNEKLEKEKNKLKSISNRIEELKKAILEISNKNYPSQFENTFEKYKLYIEKILNSEKSLEEKGKQLQSLNFQIEDQKSFQKDLELFVSKGLSIIHEQRTSSCPLCNQDYKTYNDLANAVSSNKLLSQRMSELLNEKNEIEKSHQELLEELSKNVQELVVIIGKDISTDELAEKDSRENILNINKTLTELQNKLLNETRILSSQRLLLQNKSKEEYETWAKEVINSYRAELEELKSIIQALNDKLLKAREQQQIINKKLEAEESGLQVLENSDNLKEISDFFLKNYPNQKIDSKQLVTDLENINADIQKNLNSIKDLSDTIKILETELQEFKEENVTNEMTQINGTLIRISASIDIYKLNAGKYINYDIDKMDEDVFNDSIAKSKEENEKKISDYNEEIKQLELLSELKDNVLPYLEFEENKKIENNIKSNIEKKKKVTKLLKGEIEKVNSHIEKQIKSFFYEDLINDLYKRIDPHPEYTKVKFIPDFKDAKPKLNVCVYGKNNSDDFIIPNLYFSQAQLNILSLCIFLAKALNAKDDDGNSIDCIFVDDPIQSMDSINILSTIDLLRSIVVNHEKQIILSTHDENFHNLLKKKIPSALFKSKFMELETFGKVRPSSVG
ncbi:AAA family ATPase [Chryseobacterium bernardetii]|uniref:AAA family ATPase n=1 Tax=Chryseobacterium bernardetii TaxID=1241978 RepID=UPI00301807F2